MDIGLDNALSKKTIVFGLRLWILICIGIGVIFIVFSSWVASKKNKKSKSLIGRTIRLNYSSGETSLWDKVRRETKNMFVLGCLIQSENTRMLTSILVVQIEGN